MIASPIPPIQIKGRNLDMSVLLRSSSENELRETSNVVLGDAFKHLETLIPRERRITERPWIKFITGAGIAGSCKFGSPFIEVDTAWGVTRVVPHEAFHFWQFRDVFTSKLSAFHDEKVKEQSKNAAAIDIVCYSVAEAGAYLFEAMSLKSAAGERVVDTAKYVIRDLCESFSPDSGYQILEAVYNRIRRGELEEAAGIGILSAMRGVDLETAIATASTNVGQALALLAFAANDYNIKKTFDLLISGPEEILGAISAMGLKSVEGLMRLIEGIANSYGINAAWLIDADAEDASADKWSPAAMRKAVVALERR